MMQQKQFRMGFLCCS